MGRIARDRNMHHPKPVDKIELSEKNVRLRLVIVVVLILIAVGSFGYGISQILNVDSGWTEIEADSDAKTNCSNEFVLMYELGSRDDMTITVENKGIIALYTEVMTDAYQLFHNNEEIKGVNNLYYLNQHINEEIHVDDMLYRAFEQVEKSGNRMIYLAPIYEQYNNLFDCEVDAQTKDFDPYVNETLAADFKKIAEFARDKESVSVELLGDNTIKLHVSDAYVQYANENGIASFIDFAWMKNAFVVDYLADVMIEKGYKAATISSYDGFSRNLDERDTSFSYNLYDYEKDKVFQAATISYKSAKSIVAMHRFPINSLDVYRYYVFENGEIRSSYLSEEDGLCKSAANSAYAYSDTDSCAEIMLQIAPLYIANECNRNAWNVLKSDEIHAIIIEDKTIFYNDNELKISGVYTSYKTEFMN